MMYQKAMFIMTSVLVPACMITLFSHQLWSELSPYLDKESSNHMRCHSEQLAAWEPPKLPGYLQNVSQQHPLLIQEICKHWLLPPFTCGLNLSHPQTEHFSQRNQDQFIDEQLNHKQNGFFIEVGAADGEYLSNSLFFEKSRNWTGLLVEANPDYFQSVLSKRRRAFMVNSCLSPKTKPISVSFQTAGVIGGIHNMMEETHKQRVQREFGNNTQTIQVQCLPLYSILKAMDVTHVDYFSLDIEGAELDVLYTLPLDTITVEIFSIEYVVSNSGKATKTKIRNIFKYLVDVQGYKIISVGKEATKTKLRNISKYLVDVHGYKIIRVGVGEDVILRRESI